MTMRETLTDVAFKSVTALHRTLLKMPVGRGLRTLFGMPIVELHTIGRKSEQRRSSLLTAPLHGDDRVVLIASKGGDDRNPEWYLNLVANPDVELTIDGQTRAMRARTASAEEKAQLWPQIVSAYKGYDSYRRGTTRDIPVVVCEPRP